MGHLSYYRALYRDPERLIPRFVFHPEAFDSILQLPLEIRYTSDNFLHELGASQLCLKPSSPNDLKTLYDFVSPRLFNHFHLLSEADVV